ncbi:hypothetical protein [Streptomyces sp. NPDC051662]|uniref:hypothetical protein n=1 Tax=Streptomyces sp. NPDC051662 TaxID=3154750 RepID=UPI00343C442F
MARNIGMGPSTPLYRTVIVATYTDDALLARDLQLYRRSNSTLTRDGQTLTWYEGPYNAPGKAQSRKTTWEGIYAAKGDSARADCDIEMCEPTWQRLPARKPKPSST